MHCAHEWVANHLIGKGKKPNEAEIGYQIKFPQTTRRINETKWNISTIGENDKQKNIRNLLHNIMKVEKTHITKKINKRTHLQNPTKKTSIRIKHKKEHQHRNNQTPKRVCGKSHSRHQTCTQFGLTTMRLGKCQQTGRDN
jgi:hypothetical protein